MVRAVPHRLEDALDIRKGNVVVEQVAHGVDEDHLRPTPAPRHIEQVRMQGYFKTIAVTVSPHCLKTTGHTFCIAVLATLADLGTSRHGIPGHLRPLNVRLCRHTSSQASRVSSSLAFPVETRSKWLPRSCERAYVSPQ